MKEFERQVFLDKSKLQFYGVCADCKRQIAGRKLIFLCRNKAHLGEYVAGTATGLRQKAYKRSYRKVIIQLAKYFSRCPNCGKWVCDTCFDLENGYGCCKTCKNRTVPEV